ncbi:hypothetical protein Droror1_Dr00003864, partial [Drosera rotundifolia]
MLMAVGYLVEVRWLLYIFDFGVQLWSEDVRYLRARETDCCVRTAVVAGRGATEVLLDVVVWGFGLGVTSQGRKAVGLELVDFGDLCEFGVRVRSWCGYQTVCGVGSE